MMIRQNGKDQKMTEQRKDIAARLKELRELEGKTEAELASALGVAEADYRRYETGGADIPASLLHDAARALGADLTELLTGEAPRMWGPSIIGYGQYHYRYESGHEGVMCRTGFSPRKAKHSLYILGCGGEDEEMEALLARLGKHSRGAGCLYVNKLADIDLGVLEEMIALGWKTSFERYPA